MRVTRFIGCAMAVGLALEFSATTTAAQVDTSRRAVSERRIPVRKDQAMTREAGGEVALPVDARITALESLANTYRQRLDALESANGALTRRSEAADRQIAALTDSLGMVRSELASLRSDLAALRDQARPVQAVPAPQSAQQLVQMPATGPTHSIFGNSGFYVGMGTGTNVPIGTLSDLSYASGLNVTVPIGWSRAGNRIGIRTEWGFQRLEGRFRGTTTNPDPKILSGLALLTVNFPVNEAKTNVIYLLAGGGVYRFSHLGSSSALAGEFDTPAKTQTKGGVVAGAGYELHLLGATSLFAQSTFTNVMSGGSADLRWVPLVVGFALR